MAHRLHQRRPDSVYARIQRNVESRIQAGEWGMGAMLPGRKVLAGEYMVGTATIDRAIALLIHDGVLRSEGGRGTFVAAVPQAKLRRQFTAGVSGAETTAVMRLGVVVELLEHEREKGFLWSWMTLRALDRTFGRFGGTVKVTDRAGKTRRDSKPPQDAVRDMLKHNVVDALIVIGFHDEAADVQAAFDVAEQAGVPLAYVAQCELAKPVPHVSYDNEAAGYLAARHLLEIGCRELHFIASYGLPWEEERIRAAQIALGESGYSDASLRVHRLPQNLRVDGVPLSAPERTEEERARAAGLADVVVAGGAFDSVSPSPRGILASNDLAAYGVMDALVQRGLCAGTEYALVGFDDRTSSSTIGLTSLRLPLEEMGTEAARLCRDLILGEASPRRVRLAPYLMVRQSTAGLRER